MPEITAQAVKELRDATGLPMMKCKEALQKTNGDSQAAKEMLRKEGEKFNALRGDRETGFGRIAVSANDKVGAIIELQCESAPVTNHEEFRQLAADLATQLATGPGAATPDALLDQPSPSKPGQSLREQLNDLTNRIREVFRLARILRIDAACGGYVHHPGTPGVLLVASGGTPELLKDIAMHVAAQRPASLGKEDLDPALIDKEREILSEAARKEGKPESIIGKMVEGRLRNFFSERCLLEQPFVKDDKQTVGKIAQDAGLKVTKYYLWDLGGK